jgi:membrane protein
VRFNGTFASPDSKQRPVHSGSQPSGAVHSRAPSTILGLTWGYVRIVLLALDRRFARFKDLITKILSERRERWAWFDHVACAVERYRGLRGDREAATVTYHGFLSFFPLVAVGFAILGYLVEVVQGVRAGVDRQIAGLFPGLVGDGPGQINAAAIANARAGAGAVGLVLLLYTGSAWVSSLREAVHAMWWGSRDGGPNPIVGKMTDLSVLALLGVVTLGSVLVSGAANWLARRLVDLLGAWVSNTTRQSRSHG